MGVATLRKSLWIVDLQGTSDPEGERENLDELDIRESNMNHHLKSVAEVE